MDLVHLECFVALAEDLHFGRAAARLHIGVPSLSKRIADLERELDLRLFDRSSRRVALTAAGGALLDQARRALTEAKGLRDMAREVATGAVGTIRVGYASGTGEVMTLLLRRLKAELQAVAFVPELVMSIRIGELIKQGDMSIGIVRVPPPPGLERVELTTSPVSRVVMLSTHRLATRDVIGVEDLAGETIVTASPSVTGGHAQAAASLPPTAELGPAVRWAEVSTEGELLDLVSAGFGVTLTNVATVRRNPRLDLVAKPLRVPTGYLHEYLVWRADDPSPIVRRAVEVARSMLQEFARLDS
jgi:DNA-binding transcriptional LysR family regulator